jgi:alginate O-acetyltransferase complex protein AlgI
MLFNSYSFIFIFLPTTLFFFYWFSSLERSEYAITWLIVASFIFYGWWNYHYVYLLLASILANYLIGKLLIKKNDATQKFKLLILILGVGFNLGLLGYFKFSNFLIETVNIITNKSFQPINILLPLAISFFTFQQVSFLVEVSQGKIKKNDFIHYLLYVSFFPQLIAGPIIRYQEIVPQFKTSNQWRLISENLSTGLTIFIIGLFKKIIIADGIEAYSTTVFDASTDPTLLLSFYEAWSGSISYYFQIYFDFSGYTDMAIGLARMFGFRLPQNFNSPYKSPNIIQFWRNWHITLTKFLRDFLYIPMGGNLKGPGTQFFCIMTTMLLGGLWHGASWNFIIWGGLHGLCLSINHLWYSYKASKKIFLQNTIYTLILSRVLTFIILVFLWVPFRAEDMSSTFAIWKSMVGMYDHSQYLETNIRLGKGRLIILLLIVWFLPNTQQIMSRLSSSQINQIAKPFINKFFYWKPNNLWAVIIASLATICILKLIEPNEFLYFQF